MRSVARTEHLTGVNLDVNALLREIVQCISDEHTAQMELELCALDIMERHSLVHDDRDCRTIIKLFVSTGELLHRQLSLHGLYRNKKLAFIFSHRVLDNLVFMEFNSDLVKMLNDELNQTRDRPGRFVSIPTGATILPGYV
jgi:hypothetical protein